MLAETLQHGRVRVPVAVLSPDTNHSNLGAQGGQPGIRRAPARAVVPNLQYLDGCDNVHQQRLGDPAHVPGKQDVE